MNYRRYYFPNSIVFITQVTHNREPWMKKPEMMEVLLKTLHNTKDLHPFTMLAYVFMPDHFHLLFRPADGVTHSSIMHSLKSYIVNTVTKQMGVSRRVMLWQKRYWDHVIRDEVDFARHLDYIHFNPCKHGYTSKPEAWKHTSYPHWCDRGAYEIGWGWRLPDSLAAIENMSNVFGED